MLHDGRVCCRNEKAGNFAVRTLIFILVVWLTASSFGAYQWIRIERAVADKVLRGRRVEITLETFSAKGNWLREKTTDGVLLGDLNNDGTVNFVDFAIYQKDYKK